jgi:hypothetical protein
MQYPEIDRPSDDSMEKIAALATSTLANALDDLKAGLTFSEVMAQYQRI